MFPLHRGPGLRRSGLSFERRVIIAETFSGSLGPRMKEFLKTKELWIGFAVGLALSYFFVFGYGWCEASAWFGWTQLTIKDHWDFGLKLLGGLGALVVFLWTVNQWILSKKIEFEKDIIIAIAESQKYLNSINNIMLEMEFDNAAIVSAIDTALDLMEEISDEIVNKSLGFGDLRRVNKTFLRTKGSDYLNLYIAAVRKNLIQQNKEDGGDSQELRKLMEEFNKIEKEWQARLRPEQG